MKDEIYKYFTDRPMQFGVSKATAIPHEHMEAIYAEIQQLKAESKANFDAADAWEQAALDMQANFMEAECQLMDIRELVAQLPESVLKGDILLLCPQQTESPGSGQAVEDPSFQQNQTQDN